MGLSGLAFSLSRRAELHELITEPDPLAFYEKSAAVRTVIDTMYSAANPVDHLIIFSTNGSFLRFSGSLSNTSCHYISDWLTRLPLPYYTALTLEGVRYIAYGCAVYDGAGTLGYIALLVQEDRLLAIFEQYNASGDLHISLLENGTAVASNASALLGMTADELERDGLFQLRKVGFAPFEICVTPKDGYLTRVYANLAVPTILMAALFITIFALFLRISNRHFFRPLLSVMDKVKTLNQQSSDRLEKTGEESFDALVEQVNLMLDRMDDLREIELERQKSLVVSLKKQINAHFTVNVLSVINQLAKLGEIEKAGCMTEGLSSLLQYVNAGDAYIDVVDELELLQKYITMMEIRYQSSFLGEIDWDERLMGVKIPRMLLQPVVENAIVHGLQSEQKSGKITISGVVEGETLRFTVADIGAGIDSASLAALRERIAAVEAPAWHTSGLKSIALENIQRRIWSYYGSGYGLGIESKVGVGTRATLTLPIETAMPLRPKTPTAILLSPSSIMVPPICRFAP